MIVREIRNLEIGDYVNLGDLYPNSGNRIMGTVERVTKEWDTGKTVLTISIVQDSLDYVESYR